MKATGCRGSLRQLRPRTWRWGPSAWTGTLSPSSAWPRACCGRPAWQQPSTRRPVDPPPPACAGVRPLLASRVFSALHRRRRSRQRRGRRHRRRRQQNEREQPPAARASGVGGVAALPPTRTSHPGEQQRPRCPATGHQSHESPQALKHRHRRRRRRRRQWRHPRQSLCLGHRGRHHHCRSQSGGLQSQWRMRWVWRTAPASARTRS
mmetsp:Transcript_47862/g.126261  ORF Transcript_47862/g.126261 Transcript_47862/m.126261 type:complete len:207 (+) Transcript_47862:798-1418(+)